MWFTSMFQGVAFSRKGKKFLSRGPCAPGHDTARTRTAESQVHCQDTGIFDGNIRKLRGCLEYEVQKPFLSAFLQGQDTFLAVLTTTENVIRITLSEIYQNPVPGIADKDISPLPDTSRYRQTYRNGTMAGYTYPTCGSDGCFPRFADSAASQSPDCSGRMKPCQALPQWPPAEGSLGIYSTSPRNRRKRWDSSYGSSDSEPRECSFLSEPIHWQRRQPVDVYEAFPQGM